VIFELTRRTSRGLLLLGLEELLAPNPLAPGGQEVQEQHLLLVLVAQIADDAGALLLVDRHHGALVVQPIYVGGSGVVAHLKGHRFLAGSPTSGRVLSSFFVGGCVLLLALVGGIGQSAGESFAGQSHGLVVCLYQQGVIPHGGVGLFGHLGWLFYQVSRSKRKKQASGFSFASLQSAGKR